MVLKTTKKMTAEELREAGFKPTDEVYYMYSIPYTPSVEGGFDEFGNYIPPDYERRPKPLKDRKKFVSKEDSDAYSEEIGSFADLCVKEYFNSTKSVSDLEVIQKKCVEFCKSLYENKYKPRLKTLRIVP